MEKIIDVGTVKSAVVKRNKDAHKYSVGSLLSICSSYGMAGAGILSARASLRSGIGLLRVACHKSVYPIMAVSLPEAVFSVFEQDLSIENLNKHRCVLVGCGLSTADFAQKIVRNVVEKSEIPMVLDADALNIIANDTSILKTAKSDVVITPHNMEMARLMNISLQEVLENREETALNFSKQFSTVTVLKGDKTIVACPDGRLMVNTKTGNPGMATAGSGDVLAGIIASLVAQGSPAFEGACAGVFLHGLAGDLAKEKYGEISMLATDIVECLPGAFASCGL